NRSGPVRAGRSPPLRSPAPRRAFCCRSGVPRTRLDEHRAHELIEARTVLGDVGIRFDLFARQGGTDFHEPPLDTVVHRQRMGDQRAHASGDFSIEVARIRAGDLDAGELDRAPRLEVLTPKTREL